MSKYKEGDKLEVTRDGHSRYGSYHGFKAGEKVEVVGVYADSSSPYYCKNSSGTRYYLTERELDVIDKKSVVKKKSKPDPDGLSEEDRESLDEAVNYFFSELEIERSINSCGIKEVEGLNDTYIGRKNDLPIKVRPLFERDFAKDFYKKLKDACGSGAFGTVSLTKGSNKNLIALMDNMPGVIGTDWKRNPNSGSTIKVWIFNLH